MDPHLVTVQSFQVSVLELRSFGLLRAAGALAATIAESTLAAGRAPLTTAALHATAPASTEAGTNFVFRQFAITILVEGLQCGHRVLDFRGRDFAVFVGIEGGEHGQHGHHAGATAATRTTLAAAALKAARTTLAPLAGTSALSTFAAESLCLGVCDHEKGAEREYEYEFGFHKIVWFPIISVTLK